MKFVSIPRGCGRPRGNTSASPWLACRDAAPDGAAQADSPDMRIMSARDRQPFESVPCWPSVGRTSSMAVPLLVSSEESAMSDETASHVRYIDKTRAYYQAEGYGKSYEWAHFDDIPFTP